jgi:RimJ/RimL family protein N-acetyltransferase
MKNAFLVGKKTYLRPVELADTHMIQQWHNDPEIRKLARMGELPVTYIREEHETSIARDSNKKGSYVKPCILAATITTLWRSGYSRANLKADKLNFLFFLIGC